jgi:hypothetical protein
MIFVNGRRLADRLAAASMTRGEVVLGGLWIPVDPTFDEPDIDATHINLGASRAWETTLQTWGNIKFELVSVVRRS